jgi:hypothetical protein
MSILAEVPQVSHGEVPVLTIVYLIAFLGFAGAAAVLFVTMRNASRAYDERWTVRLAAATFVTGLLAAVALMLFVVAIGFIGRIIAGVAVALVLVLVGDSRVRAGRR